jgi:hypothetical protein
VTIRRIVLYALAAIPRQANFLDWLQFYILYRITGVFVTNNAHLANKYG